MDVARPRGKPRGRGSARLRIHSGCSTWFVFFTGLDTIRFSVDAPETVNDGGCRLGARLLQVKSRGDPFHIRLSVV